MKKLPRFFSGTVLLCIAISLFSCKKSIAPPESDALLENKDDHPGIAIMSAESGCKPVVVAGYFEEPGQSPLWKTYLQKWYGMNGKVSNIKADLPFLNSDNTSTFLDLAWGEVIYNTNVVELKNSANNDIMLRVELDNNGRPIVSYFFDDTSPTTLSFADTSYYFFANDRLDSIRSTYSLGGNPPLFAAYKLIYDSAGNLKRLSAGNTQGDFRMNFYYDLGQPATGMVGIHQRNVAWTLVEFLELLDVPMHHVLTQVVYGGYYPGQSYPDDVLPVFIWDYDDHVVEDGVVTAYSLTSQGYDNTIYTEWQCEETPAAPFRKPINSKEDFMRAFPARTLKSLSH